MEKRSPWERFGPLMVVLLMILSFALGAIWSKNQYLEGLVQGGGAGAGQATGGKYKNFGEALKVYAKDLKLDEKKLMACVNDGIKSGIVKADQQEGDKFGVTGTPGFFVNGKFIGGAFPIESFKEVIDLELAGKGSTTIAAYKDKSLVGAYSTDPKGFNPAPQSVPVGTAVTFGPAEAKVTIVEYSDFQCPYCSRSYATVKQLLSDYGDKVRLVYKHYPLSFHANAQKAAEAAECARDQGKFWEMHDLLFEKQTDWANSATI